MSDVPALGELARLATAAESTEAARQAYLASGAPTIGREWYGLQGDANAAREALHRAASPAVILQLVALATGGAETERGWALALMELGKVPDPRMDGLRGVDVSVLMTATDRARRTFDATARPLTDEEVRAAIAAYRARSLTPERPADAD
jgi:hypothetical protein